MIGRPPLRALLAASLVLALGGCSARASAPALHVAGNHFADSLGRETRVFPAHIGTAEYTCVHPIYDPSRSGGVFALPTTSAVLTAARTWRFNAVRLSLNEQCWLGVNPVIRGGAPRFGITPLRGTAARREGARLRTRYRAAVGGVVARAHRAGLAVIFDLHWSAAGDAIAWAQWPLPDRQYSIPFWRSIARTFRTDRAVMFELFNEPVRVPAAVLSWRCLRNGCRVPNACADCVPAADDTNTRGCGARCPTREAPRGSYRTAGTQALVDTIRATGARQPIVVPGRFYDNDLGRWLAYRPRDRLGQIAATFHVYSNLPCADEACWTREVAPVAARVPVISTEFGGINTGQTEPCAAIAAFDERFMAWADAHGVSYGAYRWAADFPHFPRPQCSYDLLASWDGTPRYGQGQAIHDHLARVAPG
ncbi:MAG TPA: cellulase family glycosylhydrolase [Vicinamibacteria bacterium]|nr:cellulase family glycosylhydrolase [Vicinamibacteria bacterium]